MPFIPTQPTQLQLKNSIVHLLNSRPAAHFLQRRTISISAASDGGSYNFSRRNHDKFAARYCSFSFCRLLMTAAIRQHTPLRSLVTSRVNDVQRHGQEKI